MRIKRLNEDTFDARLKKEIKGAADSINAEDNIIMPDQEQDVVFRELDDALRIALKKAKKGLVEGRTNVLLIGRAGTGKTARANQWAQSRGIHLYNVDAKTLDATDLGGIAARSADNPNRSIKLSSDEFNALDQPNSVLFLDEFNRAPSDVRGALLELVNNHTVNDIDAPSGKRVLTNFLFTIAAINPPNTVYETDPLDVAELSRFQRLDVEGDPLALLKYLTKVYEQEIEESKQDGDDEDVIEGEGKLKLVNTILKNPEFAYDDDEEEFEQRENQLPVLNPRSFQNVIEASRGKKDILLAKWSSYCNPSKKVMIENILSDYTDVEDKANDALNRYAKDKGIKGLKSSDWDTISLSLDD